MTTYACPKGHDSSTDDFCDTCGARMTTAGPSHTAASPAHTAAGPAAVCPHCGAPRAGSGRFCEDCGFDHQTGKVPVLTQPVPVPATWTATVAADRGYFDANGIEGVDFPATPGSRTVTLQPPQVRIGRASASQGTTPDIDLRDDDPGVSHNHALLTLSVDGSWLLSDLGSTNGTYVNDEQKPLTAGQSRSLAPGDRVHVGAWTTITLHRSGPI
ncbi:FHA domain-containing protein [Actinoplanes sp. N902-109]|uniref:FHA domain-containing protein n=1 Tax=Actinoplanes sp. (strain N902-109) TaxID=649831 RepID=UPI0003294927|nr:FHA domain-containing protein [Actinoplanes sp. N902-109]AGL18554.1 FHA domain containing protein [Actinoplanes sp. N902-109]